MLIVMPRNTKLVLLSYLGIHLAYTISSPTTDDDDDGEEEKIINKRAHTQTPTQPPECIAIIEANCSSYANQMSLIFASR